MMQYRLTKQKCMWTVLFLLFTTLSLNACSDTNNVSGPPPPVPLSPDAKLSSLMVTSGSLDPAFSSDVIGYTVDVAISVTNVTVTAQPQNASASMTVNGEATDSGQARTITLGGAGSSTPIPIVVTAVSGSQNTYIVTVRRAAPGGNNNLQSLTVSPGSLAPTFTASVTNYTVDVATSVTSVTVTAQAQDPGATVSINGQPTTTNLSVPLSGAGTTPISIVVTAPNGSQKPYLVTVNREAPGGNNNLQSLSVSPGSLTTAFTPNIRNYTVNVADTVDSVMVTAQPQDAGATVSINDQPPSTSQSVPLGAAGTPTQISIDVTAPNTSQKTYTILVNRAAIVRSGNNNLSDLVVSAGPLNPPFDAATTSYNVQASIFTADTTVTATVADSTATLTINGLPATSGVASASIPLALGPNPISIVVTAENGSPKTYTVTVRREL